MLNKIWAILILIAVLFGLLNGRAEALSKAALEGAGGGIELVLSLAGMMCLWSGLMKIAQSSGAMEGVARLLRPLLRLIFPGLADKSPAQNAIAMNMGANIVGLANAATPLGLTAMKELSALQKDKTTASPEMIMFVVINSASLQIIPTTVAAIRAKYGAATPFDIVPVVLMTSIAAFTVGVVAAKLMAARSRRATAKAARIEVNT